MALRADKRLVLSEIPELRDFVTDRPIRELSPRDAQRLLTERPDLPEGTTRHLQQLSLIHI